MEWSLWNLTVLTVENLGAFASLGAWECHWREPVCVCVLQTAAAAAVYKLKKNE